MPFLESFNSDDIKGIPMAYSAYLELVDWTGRVVRRNKRGAISDDLPPILERLNISQTQWLTNVTQFEAIHYKRFGRVSLPLPDTG